MLSRIVIIFSWSAIESGRSVATGFQLVKANRRHIMADDMCRIITDGNIIHGTSSISEQNIYFCVDGHRILLRSRWRGDVFIETRMIHYAATDCVMRPRGRVIEQSCLWRRLFQSICIRLFILSEELLSITRRRLRQTESDCICQTTVKYGCMGLMIR